MVINISSIIRKCRPLLIINSLLLFQGSLWCQCPDNNFFKEQISSICNSNKRKPESRLRDLLQLQQQMKACHLEKDSSFMFLLQKIGVLYFKQAKYTSAIDFTKESILTAKECINNNSCNVMALVENYYNLKYYYGTTGKLEDKYAAVDSCILYTLKGGSVTDKAIDALADKTDYLFNKGDYSLCSKSAKLGEDIIQKYDHNKDSIVYVAYFVNLQANALYFSKNIFTAEKLLENRITQFKETGNDNRSNAFYTLLGLINRDKKNYTKALFYFQQAYLADSIIKFTKGCSENLLNIGVLYAKNFNRYETGLKYCDRAFKNADAEDSLIILRGKASMYVLKGMYDKAQYFFQQAFNTVKQGMDETTMLQNAFQFPGFNMLQNLSDLSTDKGDAYVQQYLHTKNDIFLKKALLVYKRNDQFLAKIKNDQQLQFSSSLVWATTARNLYEHAVEACYADNNIEDAFYFFEKSRAILLNDQINQQRWMADADIAKLAALIKTNLELDRSLVTVRASSEQYLTIQKNIYTTTQALDVLIRNIKNKNPLFYQNYLDTVFITVAELRQNILNNSKTLVEIFSGDSAVYVLTISPNNQTFTKINKQSYDSLSNSFNSFITNPDWLNRHFADFVKTAHQLYSLIFQHGVLPYGSLIISPDGASYPFEALVMNENYKQPDYLLDHYATSYTYSAKYLTNQFAGSTGTGNSVLGIAPVRYKNYKNLAELSGSDKSLENINSYFRKAKNYIFENATKNNFIENFSRYDIVQLYTHASDSINNDDPVIYFADSALYLSDLVPYRKPVTQLVVLSACETANGKLYEGEGIFSFNRGFAALGIRAAVSNLWSVDNESTYRITELFYKYLSKGLATDVALQRAKEEFTNSSSFKEKKLPYFWAGIILTGKVDTIRMKNPVLSWYEMIEFTILLVIVLYLIWKIPQISMRDHF